MKLKALVAASATAMVLATSAFAQNNPIVGGAPMLPSKTIVGNAVNSADHTTLVAAVAAAGLTETLKQPGPFTVFAPTNAGFDALPAGTVDTLLKPENKALLAKVLTAHVVAGKITLEGLADKARSSADGFYHFNALSGDALSAQVRGRQLYIYDENGSASRITIANVEQLNGMIHVVDKVLVPK